MIEVGIHFDEDLIDRFKAFGLRAPAVFDDSLRSLSKSFQGAVRREQLSGSMLGGTGYYKSKYPKITKNKMKDHSFYAWGGPLANIYEHAGGAEIVAKGKKSLKWMDRRDGSWKTARRVHLRQRAFMSRESSSFDWTGEFVPLAEAAMQKELDKQGIT
jgi:hypothetical protein